MNSEFLFTGDIPEFVQLKVFGRLLDLDFRSLQKNWKTRFPFLERRKSGGLWINVRAADAFLDASGRQLLSPKILMEKRKRNPDWIPAGERFSGAVSALAGVEHGDFINHLAILVAQKLHEKSTKFSQSGGEK